MAYKKIQEVTDEFWDNEFDIDDREIVESFLKQGHLSPATLKQYKSSLRIFCKWAHDKYRGRKRITDLKIRDGLDYQNDLIKLGLSSSAIKFKRSSVSSLYNFIELYYGEEYPKLKNIFNKAVPNVANVKKKEKNPITKIELEKLIKTLKKKEEWQKLAYLLYTYGTGCRREESRQLLKEVVTYDKFVNKKGIQKEYYQTHAIRAKGKGIEGKVRKFKFSQEVMDALRKWIEVRGEDDCPYLFVSKTKDGYRQISGNAFNLWCEEFGEIIGKKIHPHLLRSSRATIAVVEEGIDIKKVQEMLGHNDVSTTEIYVVRDDDDDDDDLY